MTGARLSSSWTVVAPQSHKSDSFGVSRGSAVGVRGNHQRTVARARVYPINRCGADPRLYVLQNTPSHLGHDPPGQFRTFSRQCA
jgi:hypothetical protein